MNKFKVMFDECLTLGCAKTVISYLSLFDPPIESYFLVEYVGSQGLRDEDWTGKLQPPEEWLVLSCDAGRSGPRIHAKGVPLHLILPQRKIRGFFLRGKQFNNVSSEERAKGIVIAMQQILECADGSMPGQRFVVNRIGNSAKIRPWPVQTDS